MRHVSDDNYLSHLFKQDIPYTIVLLTIGDNLVRFERQLGIIFSFTCVQSSHLSPEKRRHNSSNAHITIACLHVQLSDQGLTCR